MTIVYTQNFEGTTVGTLPSGWNSNSGTWEVTATDPVSGTQALVDANNHDGDIVECSAATAIADMDLRYDVDSVDYFCAPVLRADSGFSNGYVLVPASSTSLASFNVFKRIGGSFSGIGTIASGYATPVGGGAKVSVRARIEGSTISLKCWNYGVAEPSAWGGTFSDSSWATAGYFGFYNNVASSGGSTVDNVFLDNLTAATNFSITPSSQTTNVGVATGAYTLQPNGFPSSTTTVALSDGGAGGTFTPSSLTLQSYTNNPVTFTYTPASGAAGTTVTLTGTATGGFSYSGSASCNVNGGTATDFSITPSSLTTSPGVATGDYTVAPNGTPSSSTTIALSDGGAGGTFKNTGGTTITSLTFTTAASQEFTYTPSGGAGAGTITLTGTATGGLTTTHTTNCVVSLGPQTLPVTNAAFYWSLGSWDHLTSGTFGVSTDTMQSSAPGAYLKFTVSGTVNLSLDIDNSTTSGFPSGDMPTLCYSIDGDAFTDIQLSPSQTSLTLSSSLTTGSHSVEVYIFAMSNTGGYGDMWGSSGVSPTNVVRINGITLDNGATVGAPTLLPKRMIIFGDSITAGEHVLTSGNDDATQSFAPMIARALDAEFAQIGYGGQGWSVGGSDNIPAFPSAWNLFSTGRSRTLTGYDYCVVIHGTNDQRGGASGSTVQSDVQSWLSSARSALGSSTAIFMVVPPCACYESNIAAAVSAYKTASGDTKVYTIDGTSLLPSGVFTTSFASGPFQWTYDGVHPLIYGHGRIGAVYSALMDNALGGGGGGSPSGGSRSRAVNQI